MKIDAPDILAIDIECRPLSWYAGDFVSKEVTAIAARWIGASKNKTDVWLLGQVQMVKMLDEFRGLYDYADVVIGHYIRGFDLPLLNAAMIENGLPSLDNKMTHDTKLDLVKRHGMSGSLENLSSDFGLGNKVVMTQADWREANRLTTAGIEKARKRVVEDVDLQIKLWTVLVDRCLLGPFVEWSAQSSGKTGRYTP